MERQTFSLYLDVEIIERIKRVAYIENRNFSRQAEVLLERALDEYDAETAEVEA